MKARYGLTDELADRLIGAGVRACDYFEETMVAIRKDRSGSNADDRRCAEWVLRAVERDKALRWKPVGAPREESTISADRLAGLVIRILDTTITGKIAKQVFEEMWQSDSSADAIIEAKGLKQITDTGAIEAIIDKIIADNQDQVEQYRSGKDKVFGFFVGQVMKEMQGKANPGEVNRALRMKLETRNV